MPTYSAKRNYRRKKKFFRKFRKKSGYTARSSTVSLLSQAPPRPLKSSLGLPLSKKVSMRYCEELTLASTAGAVQGVAFSANGLYDPNISGTGHQPMTFDQWMAFYNHYTVIGATITVQCINASSTIPGMVGITVTDDASYSGTNTIEGRCEHPRNTQRMVGTRDSTHNGIVVKQAVAPLKLLTKKLGDDDVQGNVSANPSEQAAFSVWYAGLAGGTTTIDMLVTVDYIVILSEPKELTQS